MKKETAEIKKKADAYNSKAKMLGMQQVEVTAGKLTGIETDSEEKIIVPKFISAIKKFKNAGEYKTYSDICIHPDVKVIEDTAFRNLIAIKVTVRGKDARKAVMEAIQKGKEFTVYELNIDYDIGAEELVETASNFICPKLTGGKGSYDRSEDAEFITDVDSIIHSLIEYILGKEIALSAYRDKYTGAVKAECSLMKSSDISEKFEDHLNGKVRLRNYVMALDRTLKEMNWLIAQTESRRLTDTDEVRGYAERVTVDSEPYIKMIENILYTGEINRRIEAFEAHNIEMHNIIKNEVRSLLKEGE